MTFPQFLETLLYSQNGIFGSPLAASLNTLFYFMIFGAFFANCGGGEVLINMGLKLSDKTAGLVPRLGYDVLTIDAAGKASAKTAAIDYLELRGALK